MSEICQQLHALFSRLPRYRFPFNELAIPRNGIYVLFEKGECAHGGDRIVRVGTHTGDNQLCSRLKEHFMQENKDRSIFRKNIGRAILRRAKDSFLKQWEWDLTTRKAKEKYLPLLDREKQRQVEKAVTRYLRENFTFVVIRMEKAHERLQWERKIISTVSWCQECGPSLHWLGWHSPKKKIRESGLWLVNGLYKDGLSWAELEELKKIVWVKADDPNFKEGEEACDMHYEFTKLLNGLLQPLISCLEEILPQLSNNDNWWKDNVFDNLTVKQQRKVKQKGTPSLSSLDLAALLRVLDKNWHHISSKMDLDLEARNYVKEMQTVRNRWAHADAKGFSPDDVYRDLDTLERLALLIKAKETFIREIRSAKIPYLKRILASLSAYSANEDKETSRKKTESQESASSDIHKPESPPKPKTHAHQIFEAAVIVSRRGNGIFTRDQVRQQIGINHHKWKSGYTAIFQGMRDDAPNGALDPGLRFRNVFHRIQRGKYQLSKDGKRLVDELGI